MSIKKGYSLVVLVIAIAIILILSSVSITMLKISRDTIDSSDFIYDITTIEEMVKQYYANTGTLPVVSYNNVAIPTEMESQLDLLDNENYYEVDLGRIGNISIKDSERGYVVNEQTLRVYCTTPLDYKGNQYYTVTPELMGKETDYQEQSEKIAVVGNPLAWSPNARMRVVIPRKALEGKGDGVTTEEFWDSWTFKWDFGPKTADNIKTSDTARSFSYGDTLVVKTNGVYTIYVKDSEEKETLINVVVTKVDDIKPTYTLADGLIDIIDNETGIKNIFYKTKKQYDKNLEEAEKVESEEELAGRDELDFYLLDGKGSSLMEDMPLDVANYNSRYQMIRQQRTEEQLSFSLLSAEQQAIALEEYEQKMAEFDNAEQVLKQDYPYLADKNAETEEGKLVLYVEDYAGNAIVIGEDEVLSFNMLTLRYDLGTIAE